LDKQKLTCSSTSRSKVILRLNGVVLFINSADNRLYYTVIYTFQYRTKREV